MVKDLQYKGAMFIEYALILAFVIVAGLIFVTSNGMSGNVSTIFSKTADIMEQAADGTKKLAQAAGFGLRDGYWKPSNSDGKDYITYNPDTGGMSTTMIALDGQGKYTLYFDKDLFINSLMNSGVYADKAAATEAADDFLNKAETKANMYVVSGTDNENKDTKRMLTNLSGTSGVHYINADDTLGGQQRSSSYSSFADSGNINLKDIIGSNSTGTKGITFTTTENASVCFNTGNTTDNMKQALQNAIVITKVTE